MMHILYEYYFEFFTLFWKITINYTYNNRLSPEQHFKASDFQKYFTLYP